jgi:hypothetical protein
MDQLGPHSLLVPSTTRSLTTYSLAFLRSVDTSTRCVLATPVCVCDGFCPLQYHYPAIAPIIKEVCKEYGLQYRVLPSFWSAFKLHLAHLKEMGEAGHAPHMD